MSNHEHCPRCGAENLQPIPGGINEYDPRSQTLPHHADLRGNRCPETTTPSDASAFIDKWERAGIKPPTEWPHLRRPKEDVVYEQTPK